MSEPVASWSRCDGRRLLFIDNGLCRVGVWPELGAAITHYVDRPTGIDIIWRNPYAWPPRLGVLAQPMARGSDLYDVMDGSWYVSLPAGSRPTDYFGAPLGLHGELRCLPWTVESIRPEGDKLSVRFVGRSIRTPFVYHRKLTLRRGDNRLWWQETLENRASEPLPVAWLHHPTFGGPLLAGARLVTPARTVASSPHKSASMQLRHGFRGRWPFVPERVGRRRRDCSAIPSPGSGIDHSVQLGDFTAGWGCIWNDKMHLGFGLAWDVEVFPYAWSWANGGGLRHYPLWGDGHLFTLQPSTSPMGHFNRLVQRGQVLTVPARGEVSTTLITGFVQGEKIPAEWKVGAA